MAKLLNPNKYPENTLTKVSDNFIVSETMCIDFDEHAKIISPTPASTDTLFYRNDHNNEIEVDAIEFKNCALQNVICPDPADDPSKVATELRNYLDMHKKIPSTKKAIEMMLNDKNELFLKKYPSTRAIIKNEKGKNILVVNQQKTMDKNKIPPYLQDKKKITDIMIAFRDHPSLKIDIIFKKQFENNYYINKD